MLKFNTLEGLEKLKQELQELNITKTQEMIEYLITQSRK
jgi:hypothetical protein